MTPVENTTTRSEKTQIEYLVEINGNPGFILTNPDTVRAAVEAETRTGNDVRVSTRETVITTISESTPWQERGAASIAHDHPSRTEAGLPPVTETVPAQALPSRETAMRLTPENVLKVVQTLGGEIVGSLAPKAGIRVRLRLSDMNPSVIIGAEIEFGDWVIFSDHSFEVLSNDEFTERSSKIEA